jgi:hypothetical protein
MDSIQKKKEQQCKKGRISGVIDVRGQLEKVILVGI